jgi:hypothetical protein
VYQNIKSKGEVFKIEERESSTAVVMCHGGRDNADKYCATGVDEYERYQ